MKYLSLVFLFLSFVFGGVNSLNKNELDYIKTKKFINVCINPDWSPIEFKKDNIPQGISIDILKHISKKIGLKLKFIYTDNWVQSQKYLKLGKCDITPTAIKTTKREKYAIFTKPYLNYDLAVITTYDKPYVVSLDSIIDKTITRKQGSGLITKLKRIYPNITIIETKNFKQMLKFVADKKAYATIATLPVFAYYKKKYNFDNLKIAGFTGWKYQLRIMVNKQEVLLRDILDKHLKLITPKFKQTIYEKWIVNTKSELDYKKFIAIVFVMFLVVLIILIWGYILKKKNEELEKLSKIKSQFLSNINHELRTPLNAMMGFITLLQKDKSLCEKYLPIIDTSAKNLLVILKDMLNFTQIENNKISLDEKQFSSKDLLDIVYIYKQKVKNHNLELKIINNKLPQFFWGDIDKIRDVLIHLISNSIKFTKEGKVEVVFRYETNHLFVSVKDTGIGIPKDKLEYIFEPFTQIDNRIKKQFKGVGIGLNIAKKFVKILGGELKVKSELNKGSEFYFDIPLKEIIPKDVSYNFYNNILVVEDNKANQMFMKVLLQKLNINFELAENGKIAVELYKKHHYSLILMDINMPIMDGLEATKLIREYEIQNDLKASKIIALSATSYEEFKDKFKEVGIDGYLGKPLNIEKLKSVLNKLV